MADGRCATCSWWEHDHEPKERPYAGWGNCAAIVSWHTSSQPEPAGARMVVCVQDDTGPGDSIEVRQHDGMRGYADLWTAPGFGCVQYEPRSRPTHGEEPADG
jgi:hypothetical protein